MADRALLIRAVNVGGTAKLPMAELRELATGLGATDVSTYIASGNLLCTPPADPSSDPQAFDRVLEAAIEQRFGFFRDVISRSAAELVATLEAHPFEVIRPSASFVSFLAAAPTAAAIEKASTYPTHDDLWAIVGREMHVRYAESAGRAQMNIAGIGKALGTPGTARNVATVGTLIRMLDPPAVHDG